MPEGHSIRRLATLLDRLFTGRTVGASSPQGRFSAGAAAIDGWTVTGTDAHGKHLFIELEPPGGGEARFVHIHLGLYGAWSFATDDGAAPHAIGAPRVPGPGTPASGDREGSPLADSPVGRGRVSSSQNAEDYITLVAGGTEDGQFVPPEPRPTVRLRLTTDLVAADLTGPARCDLIDLGQKDAVHGRLGPDPLRAAEHRADGEDDAEVGAAVEGGAPGVDVERFVAAVRRTRRSIGELLMDQSVIAGVGNIYRAEALFRARIHPRTEGRAVSVKRLHAMWDDIGELLRSGVELGVILTTLPEDRPGPAPETWARAAERATEEEADYRWYVYHRAGRRCHVCGGTVSGGVMAARTVFWCTTCQKKLRAR